MTYVAAPLEKAILEIKAMRNSEVLCAVLVQPDSSPEAPTRTIMQRQAFNEAQLRDTVTSAFTWYPEENVLLQVSVPNGSKPRIHTTYRILNAIIPMGNNTPQTYNQPQQPAFHPQPTSGIQAQPLQLDGISAYLLQEKERQLADKEERIRELRDQLKISDSLMKELSDKNQKLEMDNRFKEKEFELEKRDIENNSKGGLAGVQEFVSGLPPEVLNMVLGRLLGTPTPAPAPMGSLPQMAGLTPNQQAVVEGLNRIYPNLSEEQLTKLYGIAHYLQQGQLTVNVLDNILATANHVPA